MIDFLHIQYKNNLGKELFLLFLAACTNMQNVNFVSVLTNFTNGHITFTIVSVF
jgi:hypothetical protein